MGERDNQSVKARRSTPITVAHVPVFRTAPSVLGIPLRIDMADESNPEKAFKLSTILRAHSDDVKCVYPIDSDNILSASRDRTVGVWKRKQSTKVSIK
jgi:WD40 repeat protein